MSGKERFAKEQEQEDRRFTASVREGLRAALTTPDGRAMIWWLYAHECRTEGMADHERRAVGLAIAQEASRADWGGWQLMREENQRPKARKPDARPQDEEGELE